MYSDQRHVLFHFVRVQKAWGCSSQRQPTATAVFSTVSGLCFWAPGPGSSEGSREVSEKLEGVSYCQVKTS